MSAHCDKVSFKTAKDAEARLTVIRVESDADRAPNGVYKCPTCLSFHLTSRSNNPTEVKRKEILNKYLEIPFSEYLRDTEYASNSMLKHINRSPAHLQAYIDDDTGREPSSALIFGRAAHAKTLEPEHFDKEYYVIPDDLKKGSQVYIEGKLQTRKWQDKSGQDRWTTEIVANEMQMLGGRNEKSGFDSGSDKPQEQKAQADTGPSDDFDDDIDF